MTLDEPRKRIAGVISGLDLQYDLGEGHPLLGRRMPDLDLETVSGPVRTYDLLHAAGWVLVNLGAPLALGRLASTVRLLEAAYDGPWELPVIGVVEAPLAVLIRPDGHVAWVGDGSATGLEDALDRWRGPHSGAPR